MSSARDQVLQVLTAAEAAALRQEKAVARQVAAAYEAARRDLVAAFLDRWDRLGEDPRPATIRRLANDAGLIRAIEQRLAQLGRQHSDILQAALADTVRAAFSSAEAELAIMAEAVGATFLQLAIDPVLELTIRPAVAQIPELTASLRGSILAALQEGLAAGERRSVIARAAFARTGRSVSAFGRGMTSAQLMTQRAIIQAENNARLLAYEQAQRSLPGLQKQVIAAVGGRTTETCLRAHGQVQPLDRPFSITGRPRFARYQMQPPFHWNCRSRVVAYLPQFETGSTQTTDKMRAEARAELASRPA